MGQGPKDGHHSGAFEKRKDRQGAFLDIFDIFKHVLTVLQQYFSGTSAAKFESLQYPAFLKLLKMFFS